MKGLHFVTMVPPGPHGHVIFGLDTAHPEHCEIGFGFKFLKKLNPISIAKAIAKSPIVKVVAGAAAFVCPVVGVPALAAIGMADKIIDGAKKANQVAASIKKGKVNPKKLSPMQKRDINAGIAAKNILLNTQRLAKQGDPGAKRALAVVNARLKQRKAGKRVLFVLTPDGRIHHEPEAGV